MFGVPAAIHIWLTLWLSLQLVLEDLTLQGTMKPPGYAPLTQSEVQHWAEQMSDTMSQIPVDDVEFYLPQLTAILLRPADLETKSKAVSSIAAARLASFLQAKCRENHMVGLQLLWQLDAAGYRPRNSADRRYGSLLPGGDASEMALDRTQEIHNFMNPHIQNDPYMQHRSRMRLGWFGSYQQATFHGNDLPDQLRERREDLCEHTSHFVDLLIHLSSSLARIDCKYRPAELNRQLGEINMCLLRRMETRGRKFDAPGASEWAADATEAEAAHVEAVKYALPLPLRLLAPGAQGGRFAMRILRIVRDLSHPLPSRERVPCLITAETVQTDIRYGSDRLYLEGERAFGVTAADIVNHRIVPRRLLRELREVEAAETGEILSDPDMEIEDDPLGGGQSYLIDRDIRDTHNGVGYEVGYLGGGHANGRSVWAAEQEDHSFFARAFQQFHHVNRMRWILENVFERNEEKQTQQVRAMSPFGHLKGWQLNKFIVKAGDDIRQEALAMQVICLVQKIFRKANLPLWLRPYAIVCAGHEAGLVECLTDARSIDHIKKRTPNLVGMQDFFERLYMGKRSGLFAKAQSNFIRSLAAYSLITYLLQVKDRHNANIMLDTRGHIIHIDFGFILGESPGLWTHETAPFKLTQDYIDILGGENSANMDHFRGLFLEGFKAIRKHIDDIAALVQVALPPNDRRALTEVGKLKKRFTDLKSDQEILSLISASSSSSMTWQYDFYQKRQNDIWM